MQWPLQTLNAHQFDDYFGLVADDDVMAMISGKGLTKAAARQQFEQMMDYNQHHLGGYYFIHHNVYNKIIGLCKLQQSLDNVQAAEVGYLLSPAYWGRGIASQVLKQLLEMAKNISEFNELIAWVDSENQASKKVLAKMNFVFVHSADNHGIWREKWVRANR